MRDLIARTMREDVALKEPSESLWDLADDRPQIRQIFGHFLPPQHMKIVDGLVAKDFNFPAAYHRAPNLCTLSQLHELGQKLYQHAEVCVEESVVIRREQGGAVLYTPYHNGFYVNERGWQILQRCMQRASVMSILPEPNQEREAALEFLARALTLGIVRAHAA